MPHGLPKGMRLVGGWAAIQTAVCHQPESLPRYSTAVPVDRPLALGSIPSTGRRVRRCLDSLSGHSLGFCPSALQERGFWSEPKDTKDGESLRKHLGQWLPSWPQQ